MRDLREIQSIIKDCEQLKKDKNALVEYLNIRSEVLPSGILRRRSYNWEYEINEVQAFLDNISQTLIEVCGFYKYKEWNTAMFLCLKFLINEIDNMKEEDIYERIDRTWNKNLHYFDKKKTKEAITMEQYSRMHFPWIVRLAMSDKSLNICMVYLFFTLNLFVFLYVFEDISGTDGASVIIIPFATTIIHYFYFFNKNKYVLFLTKISFSYILSCLVAANIILIFDLSCEFDYYRFIERFAKLLIIILPVIPVDIAHIDNYWRKSYLANYN